MQEQALYLRYIQDIIKFNELQNFLVSIINNRITSYDIYENTMNTILYYIYIYIRLVMPWLKMDYEYLS